MGLSEKFVWNRFTRWAVKWNFLWRARNKVVYTYFPFSFRILHYCWRKKLSINFKSKNINKTSNFLNAKLLFFKIPTEKKENCKTTMEHCNYMKLTETNRVYCLTLKFHEQRADSSSFWLTIYIALCTTLW